MLRFSVLSVYPYKILFLSYRAAFAAYRHLSLCSSNSKPRLRLLEFSTIIVLPRFLLHKKRLFTIKCFFAYIYTF